MEHQSIHDFNRITIASKRNNSSFLEERIKSSSPNPPLNSRQLSSKYDQYDISIEDNEEFIQLPNELKISEKQERQIL